MNVTHLSCNASLLLAISFAALHAGHGFAQVTPIPQAHSAVAGLPTEPPGGVGRGRHAPDAKTKIDEVCRAWAADTGEPFVTLVARQGVIVTHEAFGRDPSGQPITRDYRCWVANRGSYGEREFIPAQTFDQLLPQPLQCPTAVSSRMRDRPALDPASEAGCCAELEACRRPAVQSAHRRPRLLLRLHFRRRSRAAAGHHASPQTQRPPHAEWSPRFFQAIAAQTKRTINDGQ